MAKINLLKKVVILPIKFYQFFISPFLGNNCRFTPTCSQYMLDAVAKKGLIKGFLLGILRLSKCHPFSKKSAFDPVE